MSDSPAPFVRPTQPTEIKAYLDEKVYPVIDTSLEALLRHVFTKTTASAKTASTGSHGEDEAAPFSPLLWLSDHLRQYSR